MRENSSLWIAVVVVGGLLLAGLAGLGSVMMLKTRSAVRANAEAQRIAELEKQVADLKQTKEKGAAPAGPAPKAPDAPPAQPPASPTATERWAAADVRDYATALHKAYQGNAVAADNKYKGKAIGLIGAVVKVDSLQGKDMLFLKAGEFEFAEFVVCYCEKSERDRLAVLAEGDWVAVVGRCNGKGLVGGLVGAGVELDGCVLVYATKTEAEMRRALQEGR